MLLRFLLVAGVQVVSISAVARDPQSTQGLWAPSYDPGIVQHVLKGFRDWTPAEIKRALQGGRFGTGFKTFYQGKPLHIILGVDESTGQITCRLG